LNFHLLAPPYPLFWKEAVELVTSQVKAKYAILYSTVVAFSIAAGYVPDSLPNNGIL
jgi:hypothetical protein